LADLRQFKLIQRRQGCADLQIPLGTSVAHCSVPT
jgi:hypothetical protein